MPNHRQRCTGAASRLLRLIVAVAVTAGALDAASMGNRQSAPKSVAVRGESSPIEPEALLVKTLIEIRNNRVDPALAEVEKVIQAYPNVRLAHLIKGDLLLARSQPLRELGQAPNAPRDRIEDLRDRSEERRVGKECA